MLKISFDSTYEPDQEEETQPELPVFRRAQSDVRIRAARMDDHPRLCAVVMAAYAEYKAWLSPGVFTTYMVDLLDFEVRARTGQILVAELDGELVGTVTYYRDERGQPTGLPAGWAGLRALAVAPAARGQGIGRQLVQACIARGRQDGAPALTLHTAELMAGAMSLYRRLGFERASSFDFRIPASRMQRRESDVVAQGYFLRLDRPRG